MDEEFDILIAGGGPVGAALALGLRNSSYRVALLDPALRAAQSDARTIALSHGSRLILERLGVWPNLAGQATSIDHINVSQRGGFGLTELNAADVSVPALGYVIGYAELQAAFAAALAAGGTRILQGLCVENVSADADAATAVTNTQLRLTTRLMVMADGGVQRSIAEVESRDYGQAAVVCNVVSEQQHRNRAYERFTTGGPLALLPHRQGWSVVWTLPPARAQQLAALDDVQFCRELRAAFGAQLGRFRAPEPRRMFPLSLRYATRPSLPRVVLIGNAAQTLHPVAGQGYNLGLRDAWELVRSVSASENGDPGDRELLNKYFSRRRSDRTATILFTDTLIQLFCKDIPLVNSARGLGLVAINAIPPVKNFLTRRMLFGVRG